MTNTNEQNSHDDELRLAIDVACGYIEGITLPSNSEGGDQYYLSSSPSPLAEIAKPIDSRSSQDD